MIQHDYLLRLIERLLQALAGISEMRRAGRGADAARQVDRELQELLGTDRAATLKLSTTELLARLVRTGTALEARTRLLYVVALLKEAGDIADATADNERRRESHLHALRILLEALAAPDEMEPPQFVPTVEGLVQLLADEPLPADVLALLMRHYERTGEFGRAEDALFGLLDLAPASGEVIGFGRAYYQRLLDHNDSTLLRGNLPRSEIIEGLAELDRRAAA